MPAPGFLTDRDLADQVKDTLALDVLDVESPWYKIAIRANAAAYSDIRSILARRGYTIAQIDGWDDGKAYQADQGLFWALVRGGCAKDFDDKFIKMLDRRKDLETVAVVVGGVLVGPVSGRTVSGTTDNPARDTFSMQDADLQDWYRVGEGPTVAPNPRP